MVAVSTSAAVVALAGWSPSAPRSPAVLALAGLAALSALSAAWTVASASDALRWGAVIGALTLIAVSASIVCARVGPMPIAAVIAIAAAVAGAVGLYGAGARVEPLAQRLGGQWSPAGRRAARARPRAASGIGAAGADGGHGPSPATAWRRLRGSERRSRVRSWRSPAPGWSSRSGIAVAIACALTASRSIQVKATTTLAAAALAASAGGAADAVAGSYADPYVTGGNAPRLVGLAAIAISAAGLWALQRRALDAARSGRRSARARATAAVVVPLAAALLAAGLTPDSGPQAEPVAGFAHGRVAYWEAAVETASDRPLAGFGSLAFYQASLPYQDPPAVLFAHNLPLETWVELGVAGALLVAILYGGSAALVWSRRRSAAAWLLAPAVLAVPGREPARLAVAHPGLQAQSSPSGRDRSRRPEPAARPARPGDGEPRRHRPADACRRDLDRHPRHRRPIPQPLLPGRGARARARRRERARDLRECRPRRLPRGPGGLGSLGVIYSVTLRTVPTFRLDRADRPPDRRGPGPPRRAGRRNDHFEFFVFPHTDTALCRSSRIGPTRRRSRRPGRRLRRRS